MKRNLESTSHLLMHQSHNQHRYQRGFSVSLSASTVLIEKFKGKMACMNALCRRLKNIFSIEKEDRKEECTTDGQDDEQTVRVNVNPFAPINQEPSGPEKSQDIKRTKVKKNKGKRSQGIRKVLKFSSSQQEASTSTILSSLSITPIELSTSNITRYNREFHELELVGAGVFGSVFRCINRLDGCTYAMKRSRSLARSNYAQRRAKNEVHANAALNNHKNIVRYYSAWVEDDRMIIQLEYCNEGDLGKLIEEMRREGKFFNEKEIYRILLHIADGLRYIHGMKLAHMDIKPENIFISKEKIWTPRPQITCEKSGEFFTDCDFKEEIIYKIGDLGHVASIIDTIELDDEGDCRYLCKEVLREDYNDLTKADVFALGLTMYEIAGGGPLPKNGHIWHSLREGNIKKMTRYSDEFNNLIKLMIDLDPAKRPSAVEIIKHILKS